MKKRSFWTIGALAAAALATITGAEENVPHPPSVPQAIAAPSKPAIRYSQERLNAIRSSLAAQIAVRDDSENAMRQPTAGEAAALQLSTSAEAPTVVNLPSGAVAVKPTVSSLELLVARRAEDGSMELSHSKAAEVRDE